MWREPELAVGVGRVPFSLDAFKSCFNGGSENRTLIQWLLSAPKIVPFMNSAVNYILPKDWLTPASAKVIGRFIIFRLSFGARDGTCPLFIAIVLWQEVCNLEDGSCKSQGQTGLLSQLYASREWSGRKACLSPSPAKLWVGGRATTRRRAPQPRISYQKNSLGKWKAEWVSSNFSSPAAFPGALVWLLRFPNNCLIRLSETSCFGSTDRCVFFF